MQNTDHTHDAPPQALPHTPSSTPASMAASQAALATRPELNHHLKLLKKSLERQLQSLERAWPDERLEYQTGSKNIRPYRIIDHIQKSLKNIDSVQGDEQQLNALAFLQLRTFFLRASLSPAIWSSTIQDRLKQAIQRPHPKTQSFNCLKELGFECLYYCAIEKQRNYTRKHPHFQMWSNFLSRLESLHGSGHPQDFLKILGLFEGIVSKQNLSEKHAKDDHSHERSIRMYISERLKLYYFSQKNWVKFFKEKNHEDFLDVFKKTLVQDQHQILEDIQKIFNKERPKSAPIFKEIYKNFSKQKEFSEKDRELYQSKIYVEAIKFFYDQFIQSDEPDPAKKLNFYRINIPLPPPFNDKAMIHDAIIGTEEDHQRLVQIFQAPPLEESITIADSSEWVSGGFFFKARRQFIESTQTHDLDVLFLKKVYEQEFEENIKIDYAHRIVDSYKTLSSLTCWAKNLKIPSNVPSEQIQEAEKLLKDFSIFFEKSQSLENIELDDLEYGVLLSNKVGPLLRRLKEMSQILERIKTLEDREQSRAKERDDAQQRLKNMETLRQDFSKTLTELQDCPTHPLHNNVRLIAQKYSQGLQYLAISPAEMAEDARDLKCYLDSVKQDIALQLYQGIQSLAQLMPRPLPQELHALFLKYGNGLILFNKFSSFSLEELGIDLKKAQESLKMLVEISKHKEAEKNAGPNRIDDAYHSEDDEQSDHDSEDDFEEIEGEETDALFEHPPTPTSNQNLSDVPDVTGDIPKSSDFPLRTNDGQPAIGPLPNMQSFTNDHENGSSLEPGELSLPGTQDENSKSSTTEPAGSVERNTVLPPRLEKKSLSDPLPPSLGFVTKLLGTFSVVSAAVTMLDFFYWQCSVDFFNHTLPFWSVALVCCAFFAVMAMVVHSAGTTKTSPEDIASNTETTLPTSFEKGHSV